MWQSWAMVSLGPDGRARADGRIVKGPAQLLTALSWKQAFPSGLTSASLRVLTMLQTHWSSLSLSHLSALACAELLARNAFCDSESALVLPRKYSDRSLS